MTCEWVLSIASTIVALFLLTATGNRICKRMLEWSGLITAMKNKPLQASSSPAGEAPAASPLISHPRVGHLIGSLERLLIAAGVLVGAWEILVAVIALKTVARFKELDQKLDAEYFLVGSLFSLVWAIVITYGWMGFDHFLGLDLLAELKRSK
ncbi:hypothetical protein LMG3458_01676 [Achromobacter deleyi]|uniref:Uncharacterized protein n=1 Tax=Achromobacter deleyi TaxID=1353891 RepID=A0A6S6ZK18_9BURK|nr:hypothetical protein [Achromobacter deleyi]CAB3682126.1 hypothetical protein LMG3458_01676 [Achromobacter deleyi]CAB3830220.1 hypothetical protein LMG3481_00707 [Achromobacter deleyi]CAB3861385.1 hypothetical protein LMG3482_02285 [Achromobacter deleyi]